MQKRCAAVFLRSFILAAISASTANAMMAQTTTITVQISDAQNLHFDAGNAGNGQPLQLYQAFVPNQPTQTFHWTQVSGGWTLCAPNGANQTFCLADEGSGQVVMIPPGTALSNQGNVWTTSFTCASTSACQGSIQNVATGNYIAEATSSGNASVLPTGKSPFTWSFLMQVGIMPIGDSITWGLNIPATEQQGGYRCPLYSALAANKPADSFNFEGVSQTIPLLPGVLPQTGCSATGWDGYGGFTIGEILNQVVQDGSIVNFKPNFITFMGGTDNIYWGTPQTTAAELTNFLNYAFANAAPGVTIVVSTIPPFYPGAAQDNNPAQWQAWNAQVVGVNSQIASTVQIFQAAGYKVILNDFYSQVVNDPADNMGPDGVHPSVSGYSILANSLYSTLAPLIP
jgi:lysophospholipase L1-like esterase